MKQTLTRLALMAAMSGLAMSAKAANPAQISYQATFEGVGLITNLTATPGPGGDDITLQWTGPAYNGVNPPLAYSVKASTSGNILNTGAFNAAQNLSVFTSSFTIPAVATQTVQTMVVGGLVTGDLYCFALRANDSAVPVNIGAWLVSSARGYNINNCAYPLVPRLPLVPIGITISTTATAATISWQPVKYFASGTPFAISTAPTSLELTGYRVYQATTPAGGTWTEISPGLLSTATLSWTDFGISPSTPAYYYVVSENLSGDSFPSNICAFPTGDFWVVAYDSMSTMDIPAGNVTPLANYHISASSANLSSLDVQGGTFKSLVLTAYLNGLTPNPAFTLSGLATLSLHYALSSGQTTPSQAINPVPGNSSVFWYNGRTWIQLFGTLDTANQTLIVQTPYLGQFKLITAERPNSFSFNAAGISNREITPEVPGKNNTVEFAFDNPKFSQITGQVYDLQGHLVSGMQACTDEPLGQCLMWDAKAGGRIVPGGIYVYQIKGEGKTYTGAVVVIR